MNRNHRFNIGAVLIFAALQLTFCKLYTSSGWTGDAPLDAISPAACARELANMVAREK